MAAAEACRLCGASAEAFMTVDDLEYLACPHCGLRFMAIGDLPDAGAEKSHYDQHENDINDHGYQQFLMRLAEPLLARLTPASTLLDFGAGPGPALAKIMDDAGHMTAIYDPLYAPDQSVLRGKYDAVMASEVIEHFHQPKADFEVMLACIHPGGLLAVMTNLQDDDDAFANWYYRRDPTHVAFYREETFAYLAAHYDLEMSRISRNVTIFKTPDRG